MLYVMYHWATGWDRRFQSQQGVGNFSLHHRVQTGSADHPLPLIQYVPGALSVGIKRPGREADHSPPSSADVKNAWSYTSTPQYAFMAWCSVKTQGQLHLYLYVSNPMSMHPHMYAERIHFTAVVSTCRYTFEA
jgi:hypothetical protein